MNVDKFKLRLVSSLIGKRIKAILCSPKEVSHQLVCICMNNTARNLCDYCAFFLRKREHDTSAKLLSVTCPLWSVGNYSGPGTV